MAYTTINKSSLHFNTKLYTGNGSNGHAITGVGFQPDMTWLKNRNTTNDHELFDAVRGATKTIYPNRDDTEYTNATGSLTSFNSDGFTVGNGDGANKSSSGIASWNWKAGTTSGITQGGASITPSSYSINATSGFSIIKWTGTNANATIPHGLGVAPKMIIIKRLDSTSDWVVYNDYIGNTKRLVLNTNAVQSSASSGWFNNTSPTANVFSVGTDGGSNGSTDNYIAYCFAEKIGYSKIGYYIGTSSADGVFIYTGFKPTFFMARCIDNAEDWYIFDSKREGYNTENRDLYADLNAVEGTTDWLDIVSNGVKFRYNSIGLNASSNNYIFMAFGQSLVGSNNVPCTAR